MKVFLLLFFTTIALAVSNPKIFYTSSNAMVAMGVGDPCETMWLQASKAVRLSAKNGMPFGQCGHSVERPVHTTTYALDELTGEFVVAVSATYKDTVTLYLDKKPVAPTDGVFWTMLKRGTHNITFHIARGGVDHAWGDLVVRLTDDFFEAGRKHTPTITSPDAARAFLNDESTTLALPSTFPSEVHSERGTCVSHTPTKVVIGTPVRVEFRGDAEVFWTVALNDNPPHRSLYGNSVLLPLQTVGTYTLSARAPQTLCALQIFAVLPRASPPPLITCPKGDFTHARDLVKLKAHVVSERAVEIKWQFPDGVVMEGREVTYIPRETYDGDVTVVATTREGVEARCKFTLGVLAPGDLPRFNLLPHKTTIPAHGCIHAKPHITADPPPRAEHRAYKVALEVRRLPDALPAPGDVSDFDSAPSLTSFLEGEEICFLRPGVFRVTATLDKLGHTRTAFAEVSVPGYEYTLKCPHMRRAAVGAEIAVGAHVVSGCSKCTTQVSWTLPDGISGAISGPTTTLVGSAPAIYEIAVRATDGVFASACTFSVEIY